MHLKDNAVLGAEIDGELFTQCFREGLLMMLGLIRANNGKSLMVNNLLHLITNGFHKG